MGMLPEWPCIIGILPDWPCIMGMLPDWPCIIGILPGWSCIMGMLPCRPIIMGIVVEPGIAAPAAPCPSPAKLEIVVKEVTEMMPVTTSAFAVFIDCLRLVGYRFAVSVLKV